jgi:hypothetical protein
LDFILNTVMEFGGKMWTMFGPERLMVPSLGVIRAGDSRLFSSSGLGEVSTMARAAGWRFKPEN